MSDYISREAGIIALAHRKCGNDEYDIAVQDCIETLKQLPAADARPVVRGRWIDDGSGCVVCSECGEEHEWDTFRANFCDNCGADMREEDNS